MCEAGTAGFGVCLSTFRVRVRSTAVYRSPRCPACIASAVRGGCVTFPENSRLPREPQALAMVGGMLRHTDASQREAVIVKLWQYLGALTALSKCTDVFRDKLLGISIGHFVTHRTDQ